MTKRVKAHSEIHEMFWAIRDRQERTEKALKEFGSTYAPQRTVVTIDGTAYLYPIRASQ